MIHLRFRRFGDADWTSLLLHGDLEAEGLGLVGSALETSPFHVQQLTEEGEWEDL